MFLSPYSPASIRESYREATSQQREELHELRIAKQHKAQGESDRQNQSSMTIGSRELTEGEKMRLYEEAAEAERRNTEGEVLTAFPDDFPFPRVLPSVSAVKFSWAGDSYQESDEVFRNLLMRMKPSWLQQQVIMEKKLKEKHRNERASVLGGFAIPRNTSLVQSVPPQYRTTQEALNHTLGSTKDDGNACGGSRNNIKEEGVHDGSSSSCIHNTNNTSNYNLCPPAPTPVCCEGCMEQWEDDFVEVFLRPISAQYGTGYWGLRKALLDHSTIGSHHQRCQQKKIGDNNNKNQYQQNTRTDSSRQSPTIVTSSSFGTSSTSSTGMFRREISSTSPQFVVQGTTQHQPPKTTTFYPSHHWSPGDLLTTLHVDLDWQYVSETTMKWLRKLPQIRELFLVSVHMTSLANIEIGCPNIEVLSLKRCPCLSDLDGLCNCHFLRDVRVEDCGKITNIDGLLGCAEFSLETLIIKGCPLLRDISGLDVSGARMAQEQKHYDNMLCEYNTQRAAWEKNKLDQKMRREAASQRKFMLRNTYQRHASSNNVATSTTNDPHSDAQQNTIKQPTPVLNLNVVNETIVSYHRETTEGAARSSQQPAYNPQPTALPYSRPTSAFNRLAGGTCSYNNGVQEGAVDTFAPWTETSLPTFRNHFFHEEASSVGLSTERIHNRKTSVMSIQSKPPTRPVSTNSSHRRGRRSSSIASSYATRRPSVSMNSLPSFHFQYLLHRTMSSGSAVPFYDVGSVFVKRSWKTVEQDALPPTNRPLRRLQRRRSSQHTMYIPASKVSLLRQNLHRRRHHGSSTKKDRDVVHEDGVSSSSSSSDDSDFWKATTTPSYSDDDDIIEGSHVSDDVVNKEVDSKNGKMKNTFEFDVWAVPKPFRPLKRLVLCDCPALHDVTALRSCVHLLELVLWDCPMIESLRWLQGRRVCEQQDRARIQESSIFRQFILQKTVSSLQQDQSSSLASQRRDNLTSSSSVQFAASHGRSTRVVQLPPLPEVSPLQSPPTSTHSDSLRSESSGGTIMDGCGEVKAKTSTEAAVSLLKQRRLHQQLLQGGGCDNSNTTTNSVDSTSSSKRHHERTLRSIRTVALPLNHDPTRSPSPSTTVIPPTYTTSGPSYLTTDEVIRLLSDLHHQEQSINSELVVDGEDADAKHNTSEFSGKDEEEGKNEATVYSKVMEAAAAGLSRPSSLPTPASSLRVLVLHDCSSLHDIQILSKCTRIVSITIRGTTPVIQPPKVPLLYFRQLGFMGSEVTVSGPETGGGGGGVSQLIITSKSNMSVGSHISYVGGSAFVEKKRESVATTSGGIFSASASSSSPSVGRLLPPLSPHASPLPIKQSSKEATLSSSSPPLPTSIVSSVEIFPQDWLYTDSLQQHQQPLLFKVNPPTSANKNNVPLPRDDALLLECMQELRTRVGSSAIGPSSLQQAFQSLRSIIQRCYISYSQQQLAGWFLNIECKECSLVADAKGDVIKLASLRIAARARDDLRLSSLRVTDDNAWHQEGTTTTPSDNDIISQTLRISGSNELRSLHGISGNYAGNLRVVDIENCPKLENIHEGLEGRCEGCVRRHDVESAPQGGEGSSYLPPISFLNPRWVSQSPYNGLLTSLSISHCPLLSSLGNILQLNGATLHTLCLFELRGLNANVATTLNEQFSYCSVLEDVTVYAVPRIQGIEGLSASRSTLRELAIGALSSFDNASFVAFMQCRNHGNTGSSGSTEEGGSVVPSPQINKRLQMTQYPLLRTILFAECPLLSASQAVADAKRLIPFSQIEFLSST